MRKIKTLLKYFLFFIALLFGGAIDVFSQPGTVFSTGALNQLTYQKGGYGAEQVFGIPQDTSNAITNYRKNGRIAYKFGILYVFDSAGCNCWKVAGGVAVETDPIYTANGEKLINKATTFGVLNNTLYPTTLAVSNYVTGLGYITAASSDVLTNKSISGSTNTLSNIPNSALTNSSISFTTGSTGTAPAWSSSPVSLGGTATLNIPLASGAGVTNGGISKTDYDAFASKFTLPSLTSGSILFSNGTTITQDNSNLFWDDANNRLGIGANSSLTFPIEYRTSSSSTPPDGFLMNNTNVANGQSSPYLEYRAAGSFLGNRGNLRTGMSTSSDGSAPSGVNIIWNVQIRRNETGSWNNLLSWSNASATTSSADFNASYQTTVNLSNVSVASGGAGIQSSVAGQDRDLVSTAFAKIRNSPGSSAMTVGDLFFKSNGHIILGSVTDAGYGLDLVNNTFRAGKTNLGGSSLTSPTAYLHLAAGTSTANTAPFKYTAGTNLATIEDGTKEFDGTNEFLSVSSVRYTVAKTLTATGSLDFGNTSAQNSADLTIALTGAALGDVVDLGVPNAAVNANSSFSAWVSSSNTITVRFNNYSSGSIDPASGTFRVAIIKY